MFGMACGFEALAVMGLIIGALIASVGYSWHKTNKNKIEAGVPSQR